MPITERRNYMKKTYKTVYVVMGKGKKIEEETLERAEHTVEFLKDILNISSTIEERQKVIFEIEKGDKVYWLKDGKPKTNRIDIVTDIIKNLWGDIQFLTKELNGNRIGQAYESNICLVEIPTK